MLTFNCQSVSFGLKMKSFLEQRKQKFRRWKKKIARKFERAKGARFDRRASRSVMLDFLYTFQ